MALIVISLVVVAVIGLVGATYNKLVKCKNRVKNAWAQIDVQLQKRFDLIPNLLETVKGASKYESDTLEKIIGIRSSYMNSGEVSEKIKLSEQSESLFKSINVLHESYPDLKANSNYLEFMKQLSSIEEQVSVARMFYNDTVNTYNDTVMTFPTNIIGGMLGFKECDLFQVTDSSVRNAPQVRF